MVGSLSDRQLLFIIVAILVGGGIALADLYTSKFDTPGRIAFDIGVVWGLLALGYLVGKGDQ